MISIPGGAVHAGNGRVTQSSSSGASQPQFSMDMSSSDQLTTSISPEVATESGKTVVLL